MIKGKPVGSHNLVIRLMKGIFNKRPTFPKNNITWDPAILVNHLKTLTPVSKLSLTELTKKAVALLLLLTGQRGQSIHLIDTRNLTITDNHLKLRFGDLLKTTRPGHQQKEIKIKAYAPDRRLCIITVLREYLERTKSLRKDITALFITTREPYNAASRDTISRWFKGVMKESGLDTTVFTAHSVRSASTSAAMRSNIPLQTILNTAGWATDNVFRKYYNKPLEDKTMGEHLLTQSNKSIAEESDD